LIDRQLRDLGGIVAYLPDVFIDGDYPVVVCEFGTKAVGF
jgi:hypothetical protein